MVWPIIPPLPKEEEALKRLAHLEWIVNGSLLIVGPHAVKLFPLYLGAPNFFQRCLRKKQH